MSRIGKQIIKIPTGVNVQLTETDIKVKGSKGEISRDIPNCLSVIFNKDENTLQILGNSESITSPEIHGLFRSLVSNMVIGTSTGFTKIFFKLPLTENASFYLKIYLKEISTRKKKLLQ